MKPIIDKWFKDWEKDDLFFYLQVKEQTTSELLTNWLSIKKELSDFEKTSLEKLCERAKHRIANWNEAELRDNFIGNVLSLVDFYSAEYYFAAFSERSIQAKVNNVTLRGKVEWMVALGGSTPKTPFFFIHEYKKEKGTDNDPIGQLLATMVAAQVLNKQPFQTDFFKPLKKHDANMPIYGCYIIGRNWFFVVLVGKNYTISPAYDATNLSELQQIVYILKEQKQMIINRLRKVGA